MPSDKPVMPRAAYVEEEGDDGERVRGTRRSASTKKKSDKGERSSRSSRDKIPRSDSGYSSHAIHADSDASSPPQKRAEVVREKESKEERHARRKSLSGGSTKSPQKSSKPSTSRNVSFPTLEIPFRQKKHDPSYYGVSSNSTTPISASASRPTMIMPSSSKSSRPQSFYGGMPIPPVDNRPPMARSAFYVPPPPAMPMPTSYPPASPSSWMNYAAPMPHADSYFAPQPRKARPLAERFMSQNSDPIQRTSSASGIKQQLTRDYYDQFGFEENVIGLRRRSKEAEDLRAMPPPPRPDQNKRAIRRVTTSDSRDMPSPFPQYADELDDEGPYDRRSSRAIHRGDLPRRRSSTSRGSAFEPGLENARIRIEGPNGRRRSYYDDGPVSRTASYEEKIREASGYQEEVAGGPTVNLTAEALRRSQRPSGSSRSTRSSGSRDESDFKRSATTRTTTSRSGQDSDDVTIRFTGGATVNIAGAEIKCDDGAEVNIVSRRKSIRNGSERSGSDYGTTPDDRQSRGSRPVNLSRSTSKSGYSDPYANPWTAPRPRIRGDFF